jgi:Xaa-Pro aminopeptidase
MNSHKRSLKYVKLKRMFDKLIYVQRRKRLRSDVGSGLILLLGNEESSMNYTDNLYPFRQDSSFLYFFGIDRPGLIALIDIDADNEIIFGDDLSIEQMVWTGYQAALADQAETIGVNTVRRLEAVEQAVQKARDQHQAIHFLPAYRPEQLQRLAALLNVSAAALPAIASVPLIKAIVAQRSIKAEEEIAEIEKAVNTTIDMQLEAIRYAKEGMTEASIAGRIHGLAISAGGNLSFPTILTVNGQILHNHYSNNVLSGGQLVLCDCGAESSMHYAGDLTRTFPVSSGFSSLQKEVYELVLHTLEASAGMLRPGILYQDVHLFACEKLVEGLKQFGLMKGAVKEAVAAGAHALFFPCGLGHMMGLDTHDMENLGEQYVGYTDDLHKSTQFGLKSLRLGRALEAGFVLTVEPGLYFIPELIDLWQGEKKLDQFINYDKLAPYKTLGGIRLEDDYLITGNGARILGKQLPKLPGEIESYR